ncbi:MAG: ubiquinone/menaquinone biosynthesis C-methylase UbiE [Bacteroidia bacterium]|jgi:ubiquinone/menaquinone biosynthesis C-methylase UbiE
MTRDYQHNYSELKPSLYNSDKRHRKAETIVRVCRDFASDITNLHALDVGSSNGIIDDYLAVHFEQVTGIDIDAPAMVHAQKSFNKPNLHFLEGDAMKMDFDDNSFDAAVCTQIYEHVPSAEKMFLELYRVLKPGGFCYFAGNNRLMLMEPHYNLPLLSVLPRLLAHRYLKLAGKGDHYHEKHFTRGTLCRLCKDFEIIDYSARVIAEPEKFAVDYMLPPGSVKWRLALALARTAKWLTPMIWILRKPAL